MSQLLQYYKSFQLPKQPAVAAAPTFKDLTVDDQLSELQRVVRYSKSNIALQRLVHVKLLSDVAETVGFAEAKEHILPLMTLLAGDSEPPIKQHLLAQLALLAKVFSKYEDEAAYEEIVESILPVAAQLLEDEKTEVRQTAVTSLASIADYIEEDDLGQHVLTIILRLSHDDDKEEMRMTASELLNLLADRLGTDLCKQFVIPEIVSLAEDPVFRVRKAAALNFFNICKVGGEHELFERLMPAFVRLSKDDMYRVRKAVAQSLSDVSKNVSDDIRLGVLIEIFLRLAVDSSRQVKQCVLQQAGMFIATLPPRAINETILGHYLSMAHAPTGDMATDAELQQYCAYCFPGVLQTVGGRRWPELRKEYHTLLQSRNAAVKQTLSLSLHEIARILHEGNVSVDEELLPVFEDMIQDVEVVQVGVIKNIAKFLAFLSPPCRSSYLPLLHDFLYSASPFNWRMRHHLAVQLSDLLLLTQKSNVCATMFPLIMALFQDPVSTVRHAAFKGLSKLIILLDSLMQREEDEVDDETVVYAKECLLNVIQSINVFMTADVFQKRLLWLEVSNCLLKELPRRLVELFVVRGLVLLTSDPVCNVRVALGVVLTGWGPEFSCPTLEEVAAPDVEASGNKNPYVWLFQRSDIRECVKRLSEDDGDVFFNMSKLAHLFPDIKFAKIVCRGLKRAPGGSVPVEMLPQAVTLADVFPGLLDGVESEEEEEEEEDAGDEVSLPSIAIESGNVTASSTPGSSSNSKNFDMLSEMTNSKHLPHIKGRKQRGVSMDISGGQMLGSPIDASSAALYNLMHNKPPGEEVEGPKADENGGAHTPLWAEVDDVGYLQNVDLLPQEVAEIYGGNAISLPKNFDYDDEEEVATKGAVLPPMPPIDMDAAVRDDVEGTASFESSTPASDVEGALAEASTASTDGSGNDTGNV